MPAVRQDNKRTKCLIILQRLQMTSVMTQPCLWNSGGRMYNLKRHKINPPALNQTTSYWSWEPLSFPLSFFLLWMLAVILEAQLSFHWSSRTPFVPPLDLACSFQHAVKLCTCHREELLTHLACLQRYLSMGVVSSFGIWRDKVRNYGKIIKKVKATN